MTDFEPQVRSESLIPRGDAIHAQATVISATVARRGELSLSNERSTSTPGSADSLLSHEEIMGNFDFKDQNDGNHFLAYEIDSRVAERTNLER